MSLRLAPDNDPARHAPLIRVFRKDGEVVATLTKREQFDPDNDGLSSYAALVTTMPRPPADLLRAPPSAVAWVWLADDVEWQGEWGPHPEA